ncbi:MAG TPA: zinc ribbon domain-containing protein, partial [Vicinamibacterales bacterium]|nr:zinc ribbon domain-containing protein [Vicinamibacterales bacterium]
DALAKVKAGLTTPEELLRVVSEVQAADTACSGCGATVGSDFIVCPTCGKRLSDSCPGCARAMEPGWTFCPYCARNTAQSPSKHIRNRKACGSMRNVTEFKKALPV